MAPKSGAKGRMTGSEDNCQAGYFLVSGPCDLTEILRNPGKVKEIKGMGEWVTLGQSPEIPYQDPSTDNQYTTDDERENSYGEEINQALVDVRGELSHLREELASRVKDLQGKISIMQKDNAEREMARRTEAESRQKNIVDLLNLLLGEIRILRQAVSLDRKHKSTDESGPGSQQFGDLLDQVKALKSQLTELTVTRQQTENEMKIAQEEWKRELDEREHRLIESVRAISGNKGTVLQENAWWQRLLGM